jgi:glycosyltransferase involved in cell wall biosynthesis
MQHEFHPLESGIAPRLQPASKRNLPLRVALVGNHLPRQCGIATFTTDLCDAIASEYAADGLSVVAVNDAHSSHIYPQRVHYEIAEGEISSYRSAARYLNVHSDLVCLQHEYGIYGGDAGSHVLQLLRYLTLPVVTTLHTVLRHPDNFQRTVMLQIAARSDRMIVMSKHSSRVLQEVFEVKESKIDVIPHGIPDLPFVEPGDYKEALKLGGKSVLLTFGLLSPNKGFESVIQALPRILSRHSNAIYMIAGATHPHVRAREGDRYRDQLQALAREMGVEKEVLFHNRFVTPQEMASLVGSADIYITPYCHEAQAVSGTLAYALGAGKAIISTPYWHASELLDDGRGRLIPFDNPDAIATAAIELLDNEAERRDAYGRQMVWSRVGQSYMLSFVRANAHQMRPFDVRRPMLSVESEFVKERMSA